MSAPNDDRVKVDEEAGFPPREISFQIAGFNDDDNTIASELTTLLAPSTLTPSYNPDLHGSLKIGKSSHESSVLSRKAFQLAALLGFLSIGAIFGADVVYMIAISSDDVSQVSSSVNMHTWRLRSPSVRGGRSAESSESDQTHGQEKISKKTKAKKTKAGKQKNEKNDIDAADNLEDDDELIVTTERTTHEGAKLVTLDIIATTTIAQEKP